jgi:hypothetical protein
MGMEEWKVQATDMALYDEEYKTGLRNIINISWAICKSPLVHFIPLSLTKFLDINYCQQQQLPSPVENREEHWETHEGKSHQVSTSQPPSQCHVTDTQRLPPMRNIDPAPASTPIRNCL